MQTPRKEPESCSMTHEEEEEMLHDISKLQEQVQHMSRSQKLTEAKINGVESEINGMKVKMDDSKTELKRDMVDLRTDLKTDMDELKINMNKLLQEMGTKGERVLKETHE